MKVTISLAATLLFAFSLFAQQADVPKEVKNSLKKHYPKATEIKWDKEGEDFEASFLNDNKSISVVFDEEGEVVETETAMDIINLPKSIVKNIQENYKGYKISEASKIVKRNGEEMYEAEVTDGKSRKDLLFDMKGNPISKNAMQEKEDEEDED